MLILYWICIRLYRHIIKSWRYDHRHIINGWYDLRVRIWMRILILNMHTILQTHNSILTIRPQKLNRWMIWPLGVQIRMRIFILMRLCLFCNNAFSDKISRGPIFMKCIHNFVRLNKFCYHNHTVWIWFVNKGHAVSMAGF